MIYRLASGLLTILLMFWASSSVAQDPTRIVGWENLDAAISSQNTSNMSGLNGKTFQISFPDKSVSDFKVTPIEAFSVTTVSSNTFRIKIVNADALLVNDSGLVYKVAFPLKSDPF